MSSEVLPMTSPEAVPPQPVHKETIEPIGKRLRQAWEFWEPWRLIYNAVLLAVVVGWVALSWPHFRGAIRFSSLPPMAALALAANLCYSAVYLIEVPLLRARRAKTVQRVRWGL